VENFEYATSLATVQNSWLSLKNMSLKIDKKVYQCHFLQALASFTHKICSIMGSATTSSSEANLSDILNSSRRISACLTMIFDSDILFEVKSAICDDKWLKIFNATIDAAFNVTFEIELTDGDSDSITSLRKSAWCVFDRDRSQNYFVLLHKVLYIF